MIESFQLTVRVFLYKNLDIFSIDFKKLGEDNMISALKLLKENGNFLI